MSRQPQSLAPADVFLDLLRASRLTYCCCDAPGRWIARCPLCAEMTLTIHEHGERGRVSLRCSTGCDSDEILYRLNNPERCYSCGTVHGVTERLSQAAGQLLELAHDQQRLVRQVLDNKDFVERVAA